MATPSRDITAIVLAQSELPRDIAAVQKMCAQLPMVSACDAELVSFKGRPIDGGRYEVDITGKVNVRTKLKVSVALDAAGVGVIDSNGRDLTITEVRILNDFHGIFSSLLQMTGLATGRSLRLREKDSTIIRNALAA
jgi:hypothetical protein